MVCSNKCSKSSSLPSKIKSNERTGQCPTLQQRQQMFQHPKDQNVYEEEDALHKNDTLI